MKNPFYSIKYKNNHKIIRILFFKMKFKLAPDAKEIVDDGLIHLYCKPLKHLGKCTYMQLDTYIQNEDDIIIGAFCSIGSRVVLGHGEHPMNYISTSPYFYFDNIGYKTKDMVSHNEFWEIPPIHIGNDVWIGDGVFVKNGVTIGDGAIIGARSVVTKDVPPYAIVVGCPARVLRYRYDRETIDELLRLKWWDLDDDIIKQIPYDNVEESLKFLRKVRGI